MSSESDNQLVPNNEELKTIGFEFDSQIFDKNSIEFVLNDLMNRIEDQNEHKLKQKVSETKQLSIDSNNKLLEQLIKRSDNCLDIQMVPIFEINELKSSDFSSEKNSSNEESVVPQMSTQSDMSSESSDSQSNEDSILKNNNFFSTGLEPIKKRKFVKRPLKVGINKRLKVQSLHKMITN
jgi:hypothetical protein